MKTKIKLLLTLFLSLFVFTACNQEDELIDANQILPETASKADIKKINPDITISPSGDVTGVIDGLVIDAALNGLSPGGIVLLESGTFYLNDEITISNFSGTLTGSGYKKTEIIGVGDEITPFTFSRFFHFDQPAGSLTVSNLSLSLPDGFITDFGFLNAFIQVDLTADGSDTHFERLRLTGLDPIEGNDPIWNIQPEWGIIVRGDLANFPSFESAGLHTITNSVFSKCSVQATLYEGFKNATIEITNNYYSEIKQTLYRWMSGSSLSITNNDMEAFSWGTIVVTQEFKAVPGNPNSVLIRGNNVSTAGYMPVEIGAVQAGYANFMLLIEENNLSNTGPDPLGWFPDLTGIGIFSGNDGAIVRNNIIRGGAEFGVFQESNHGSFIGNNLQGFNPSEADYGLFGDNNTIVGSGNSSVLDEGNDNNYETKDYFKINDVAFEDALNFFYPGLVNDGWVAKIEAEEIKYLDINDRNIKNLSEIKYFINLVRLACSNNLLKNINISKNTKLELFACRSNSIESLNLSKNTQLKELYCWDNKLENLDLSNNINVEIIHCWGNELNGLDLSNNTELTFINCNENQLSYINIGSNNNLEELHCVNNKLESLDVSQANGLNFLGCFNNLLSCIQVNQDQIDTKIASWVKDDGVSYSLDCN